MKPLKLDSKQHQKLKTAHALLGDIIATIPEFRSLDEEGRRALGKLLDARTACASVLKSREVAR